MPKEKVLVMECWIIRNTGGQWLVRCKFLSIGEPVTLAVFATKKEALAYLQRRVEAEKSPAYLFLTRSIPLHPVADEVVT